MQNTASVLTDTFSEVLERLPIGLDLDRLALETEAISCGVTHRPHSRQFEVDNLAALP
jgi:hypothetical protein